MKVLIVTPVFHRMAKMVSFLDTFVDTDFTGFDYTFMIAVNAADDVQTDFIRRFQTAYNTKRGAGKVKVAWHKQNIGKARAINQLVRQGLNEDKYDFICTLDSDIQFPDRQWLRQLIDTYTQWARLTSMGLLDSTNLGCVSANQLESDVSKCHHIIDTPEYQGSFGQIGKYKIWQGNENGGLGGACFLFTKAAWLAVGGYYDKVFIGGDDAHMLKDLSTKHIDAILNLDVYIIHPRSEDSETEYVAWKNANMDAARPRPTEWQGQIADYSGPKI
jgi:glycosyltransferase involved in cell wall biosynthesis